MEENQNVNDANSFSLEEIEAGKTKMRNQENSNDEEKDDVLSNVKTADLDFIMDIPLKVSVIFGKAKMRINDLIQLGQGSVIELDKEVGEPLEIYVNEKLLALGEVVVINEKFGIKLLNIVSPEERLSKLK